MASNDPNAVGQAFVPHYYNTFDKPGGAAQLAALYTDQSMMTFEGTQLQGRQAIVDKLSSFGQMAHSIKSIDVQPSSTPTTILVFVTGSVKIGNDNPLHFCEMFQLVSTGPGAYYVHNDIFRLNYGL